MELYDFRVPAGPFMPLYLHVSESFEERGPYNNGPAFVIQQAVYEVAGILQFGQRKKRHLAIITIQFTYVLKE